MEEIIIPQNTSTDSTELPSGYQRYVIPDSLQESDRLNIFRDQINAVIKKQIEIEKAVDKHKKQVNQYSKELKVQTNRNMEVIGIFSSIIALLIIDVNIIKSAQTLLSALILIISLTCSLAIFSIMIHAFFSTDDSKRFDRYFWIPVIILCLLLVYGIGVESGYINNTSMKPDIKVSEKYSAQTPIQRK